MKILYVRNKVQLSNFSNFYKCYNCYNSSLMVITIKKKKQDKCVSEVLGHQEPLEQLQCSLALFFTIQCFILFPFTNVQDK